MMSRFNFRKRVSALGLLVWLIAVVCGIGPILAYRIVVHAGVAAPFLQGPGKPTNVTVNAKQSGTVTCTGATMAAGTTPAQVNTRISSSANGDVICFAAGSYTWGGGTAIQPPQNKGITLICVTEGACNVSYSGSFPGTWRPGFNSGLGGTSTGSLYRISGFNFTAAAAATLWLAWDDSAETTVSNIRIDHNTWTLDTNDSVMNMSVNSIVYLYGVFDHDTITAQNMTNTIAFLQTPTEDTTNPVMGRMGTGNNLFIEDSRIISTTGGLAGCIDAFSTPSSWVIRFSEITNCRLTTHGVAHGYGPSNIEYYGNTLTYDATASLPSGYRAIHAQGSGTNIFWGNRLTATSTTLDTNAMAILHYFAFQPNGAPACDGVLAGNGNRSPTATYRGYPCYHQPGRDVANARAGFVFYPVASFLNIDGTTGAKVDLQLNGGGGPVPDYTNEHMKANRDYWNGVSATANSGCPSACTPFDGTTGIGYGTLAQRPTTCTVGPDSDVGEPDEGRSGVMYWATDQGSWNTSTSNPRGVQQNGADGVLYMCTATNTWSVYYTPYTYPHPLQSQ
jgi:hypothetical protein